MRVKFCPKCGSEEINMVSGWFGMWECRKCKFRGAVFPEKEVGLKDNNKGKKTKRRKLK